MALEGPRTREAGEDERSLPGLWRAVRHEVSDVYVSAYPALEMGTKGSRTMNGNGTIQAALYCRISRDAQGESLGVQRQAQDCREVAARKGWEVIEPPYIDNDISASSFSKKARTRYLDLLADIEAGRINAVVMWAEDRTHRQVLELAQFIELCQRHNVQVATPAADYDLDDPSIWIIKVSLAQSEVNKTSKRLRRQRLQAAEAGAHHAGGTREFGDRGKRRTKRVDGTQATEFIVSAEQARIERELICEAAERLLTGDSLRGIRLEWTDRGITTATGKFFQNQTLRKLLLSPRVAGFRTHLGKLHKSAEYPEILDFKTWEAVCDVLRDPSRTTNLRGGTPRHLLSGFLFCGLCGHRLYSQPRNGRMLYRCTPTRGTDSCGKISRLAEPIETLILTGLFYAVENHEWEKQARARTTEDDPTRELYERRSVVVGLLDRLEDKVADELITPQTAKRKRAEYERELEVIHGRLARVQGDRVVAAVPANLRAIWPSLSLDRRRALLGLWLRATGKRIELHPQPNSRVFDLDAVRLVEMPGSRAD